MPGSTCVCEYQSEAFMGPCQGLNPQKYVVSPTRPELFLHCDRGKILLLPPNDTVISGNGQKQHIYFQVTKAIEMTTLGVTPGRHKRSPSQEKQQQKSEKKSLAGTVIMMGAKEEVS